MRTTLGWLLVLPLLGACQVACEPAETRHAPAPAPAPAAAPDAGTASALLGELPAVPEPKPLPSAAAAGKKPLTLLVTGDGWGEYAPCG